MWRYCRSCTSLFFFFIQLSASQIFKCIYSMYAYAHFEIQSKRKRVLSGSTGWETWAFQMFNVCALNQFQYSGEMKDTVCSFNTSVFILLKLEEGYFIFLMNGAFFFSFLYWLVNCFTLNMMKSHLQLFSEVCCCITDISRVRRSVPRGWKVEHATLL